MALHDAPAPRGSVSDADAERKRAECRKRVVAAAEAFYRNRRAKGQAPASWTQHLDDQLAAESRHRGRR